MNVIAWSPNLTQATAAEVGVRSEDKDSLFSERDVVTLHVRLSERSTGVVGERALELLGPTGVLVNTARGPLVDEKALISALTNGWIRGAALYGSPVRKLNDSSSGLAERNPFSP